MIAAFALLSLAPVPPVDRFYDGHSPIESWDMVKVRKIHSAYGTCVVRRNHDISVRLVIEGLDNARVIKNYPGLIDGDCLVKVANSRNSIGLHLPGEMLRYSIADALVAKDLASPELTDLERVAPLRHLSVEDLQFAAGRKPRSAEAQQSAIDLREGEIFMSKFGECVVRADPLHAHQFLRASVATAEESSALKLLAGALTKCAPGGASFKVNRTMMRGTIAVNYYRLATAPRSLPTPGVTN